jgi:hypothetical protein
MISALHTFSAAGAAFDIWNKPGDPSYTQGWIDSNGNRFSERYQIYINPSGETTLFNEPVKISPFFPQNRCATNSIRILHLISGNFTELPYILMNNDPWNVNYTRKVDVIFVAPVLPGEYYLVYSYNTSIPAPNYSGQFVTVKNNVLNSFYNPISQNLLNLEQLEFNEASNITRDILLPDAGDGMFFNVTNARFNLTIDPRFYEIGNISLPGRFPGMGAASVRFYNGSAYNHPDRTYMLIGWPYSTSIYYYDSGSWQEKVTINVPNDPLTGMPAQVSGMFLGQVWGTNTPEFVFGTKNGSTYVYSYDGETNVAQLFNLYVKNQETFYTKTYGITSVNMTNAKDSLGDNLPDLVFGGGGANIYTTGRMQTMFQNGSDYQYDTSPGFNLEGGYHYLNNNYSIRAYAQANHQMNEWENFFPSLYQITESGDYRDMQEYMVVFPESGYLSISVIHPYRAYNTTTVTQYHRMKNVPAGLNSSYRLIEGNAGTIAYSKKFTDNGRYAVMAASSATGLLKFKWYEFRNWQTRTENPGYALNDFGMGYSDLVEKSAIDSPIEFYQTAAFSPTWGNIDGVDTSYDDVLFVDSIGRYFFLTYDISLGTYVVRKTDLLLGYANDYYGTGQSIDSFDYTGNGLVDIAVGDDDGIVHFMNFSFGQNINTWISNGSAFNNRGQYDNIIQYSDNIKQTNDFAIDLNNSIGISPVIRSGQRYWNSSIKIEAGSPCSITINNLLVYYDTNNYSLVSPNRLVSGAYNPSLPGIYPGYADLDRDGLFDVYEYYGLFVWSDIQTYDRTKTYRVFTGNATYIDIRYNETVADPSIITDPNLGDSDGDGLTDLEEVLVYGTNPRKWDTDGDGLSDYFEVKNTTYFYNASNTDTDSDQLPDNREYEFLTAPDNWNTDNDTIRFYSNKLTQNISVGLSDYDEIVRWNTNPLSNDTDGDGLTDLQELGIWDPSNSSNVLRNVIKSGNVGTQYYAWTNIYILTYFSNIPNNLIKTGLDPKLNDTDGDGLSDFEEIFGLQFDASRFVCDPLSNDTDGDGLSDGIELFNSESNRDNEGIHINYTFKNRNGEYVSNSFKFHLDPDDDDWDRDGLQDGLEILTYKTNPIERDTDGDKLWDGEEIYGYTISAIAFNNMILQTGITFAPTNASDADSDGDGLLDGEEIYGLLFLDVIVEPFDYLGRSQNEFLYTNPWSIDSDGDGWTDYEEVILHHTNPIAVDSDRDGIPDPIDRYPVVANYQINLLYVLMIVGIVGSVSAVPLNKYSATKALARKFLYKEKLEKRTKGMDQERKEMRPFSVRPTAVPTTTPGKFRIKITMEIKDPSFFGRACRVSYSAGASEFVLVNAEKVNQETYNFMLDNIPVDERVMYFVEFLDKGGIWVRDDNEGKFYTFATNKDGKIDTADDDEWKVKHGVKCTVCGYLCQATWTECPDCGTPLHEDPSLALTEDEKKKREEAIKKAHDAEAIAWEEAQETDEVWRGLPTCPQCGMSVQPDWASCPVCQFDLTSVKLKKEAVYSWVEQDADYLEGKDESEIQTEYENDVKEVKSEKEVLDELDQQEKKKKQGSWGGNDGDAGDIL